MSFPIKETILLIYEIVMFFVGRKKDAKDKAVVLMEEIKKTFEGETDEGDITSTFDDINNS